MRRLMIGVASVVGFFVLMSLVIDEGEVVHLRTVDSKGVEQEADLWVVDLDGVPYLRANSGRVRWLAELRRQPEVRLQRLAGGEWQPYRAVVLDNPRTRARIDSAMEQKYGYVEFLWDLAVDPTGTVPIRLDPVSVEAESP